MRALSSLREECCFLDAHDLAFSDHLKDKTNIKLNILKTLPTADTQQTACIHISAIVTLLSVPYTQIYPHHRGHLQTERTHSPIVVKNMDS